MIKDVAIQLALFAAGMLVGIGVVPVVRLICKIAHFIAGGSP